MIWFKVLISMVNKSMLQKFQTLEVLHLHLSGWCDNRDMYQRFGEWPVSSTTEGLSELHILPLETVIVICMDTKTRHESRPSGRGLQGGIG